MLFNEYIKDDSPVDDTKITQTMLYYSEDEVAEFKKLCKLGMKDLFPADFLNKNISDFLLTLLKKHYAVQENTNQQAS